MTSYIVQAVSSNGIAIVLLVSLMVSFKHKFRTGNDEAKTFFGMLIVNTFLCAAEATSIVIDGKLFPGAVTFATALNSSLFMGNIIFVTLWLRYAELRVRSRTHRRSKLFSYLKYVPTVFVLIGSFVNLFTPVFFTITDQNIYQRSGLFLVTYAITYLYILAGTFIAYGIGQKVERYVFLPAITFLTPVVMASIIQYIFPGYSLLWAGSAIGLASAYVSLLDENSAIDPLSGTFTRHFFNQRLRSLGQLGRGSKLIAGIMLDVDNFKHINDTHGHMVGDDALKNVGRILRKAVLQHGSVFRFGGDEYVIILRIDSDRDIAEVIENINRRVDNFNNTGSAPYHLSLSIGYTIYASGEPTGDFVKRMDDAMYETKKRKALRLAGENTDFIECYRINPDRNRILIVDDDFINREILKNIFPSQYRIEEAEDGHQALGIIDESLDNLCAILLDMNMPGMSGLELLRILNDRHITENMPIFLVTADSEYELTRAAYELGAIDVISKPVVPFVILRRVQSILELFHSRETLQAKVEGQEIKLQESADTIDTMHRNTIEALAAAIEFRDIESGEHINRIYSITKHILSNTAMGEGFTPNEIESMAIGSIMHDIGKIAISDVILNKPGKLTSDEYETMKKHTFIGARLIENISEGTKNHPYYRYACDIALHHHERWDGRGYPDHLKGEEITVWAQVASIADVYDALLSPRVYKKPYTPDVAVDMIVSGQCGVFNPKLIECFLQVEHEMREWYVNANEPLYSSSAVGVVSPSGQKTVPEVVNSMLLIDAVKTAYDMIISVNLTRNSYTMVEHGRFKSHQNLTEGVFDDLIDAGKGFVPESHRERFVASFSRESLLAAFARGEREVSLEYPQISDDGEEFMVSTTVVLMEDTRNGDILEITLTCYI